jgi:acyl carrier protein
VIWITIESADRDRGANAGAYQPRRVNTFQNPADPAVSGQHRVYQRTQKFWESLRYFTFALYHGRSSFNEKAKRSMSIRLRIISEMQRIAAEQQVTLPPLDDDLSLHETGFDSLGFAILVARLEDDLGIDPFTIAEDAAFPQTVGDFIRAYENVPA